ncbi:MAG: class I SAM-dependent methyltransferase [Ktedonobacterales bacterium]
MSDTLPPTTRYIGASDPAEAERLAAQDAGILDELRVALALHPPASDARVLELGCGNGVYTRALLAALPCAAIVAIERDPHLLARARESLAAAIAAGRLTLLEGDAARLPFAAREFGLVTCRCLLMHQPEPLLVVSEMFRVAATGGGALAIEPDWAARALYPDAEAYAELLALAGRARPFGFPDLLLGRKLFALFRAAGFSAVRTAATTFAEAASDQPPQDLPGTYGPIRLLEQGRALIRGAGLATDAELDTLIARLAASRRHPEYFSGGADFVVSGVKTTPLASGEERFV